MNTFYKLRPDSLKYHVFPLQLITSTAVEQWINCPYKFSISLPLLFMGNYDI